MELSGEYNVFFADLLRCEINANLGDPLIQVVLRAWHSIRINALS